MYFNEHVQWPQSFLVFMLLKDKGISTSLPSNLSFKNALAFKNTLFSRIIGYKSGILETTEHGILLIYCLGFLRLAI